MSKYIDLAHRIDHDKGFDDHEFNVARLTLDWLDSNPDQVPGRTITEVRQSDVDRVTRNSSDKYTRGVYAGLLTARAKIVPDPEPTNAERLIPKLKEVQSLGWMDGLGSEMDFMGLARELDSRGVKAPEEK